MTSADLYLICFIVGFTLSLISALGGFIHMPHGHHGHLHLSHGHGHAAGVDVSHSTSRPYRVSRLVRRCGYLVTSFGRLVLAGFLLAVGGGVLGGSWCSYSW